MKLIYYILTLSLISSQLAFAGNYNFNGTISREVLDNYLSRAITLSDHSFKNDIDRSIDRQMLQYTGAKFVGRATYIWGNDQLVEGIEIFYSKNIKALNDLKNVDTNIIIQACIFEAVGINVTNIPIPNWVFEAFSLTAENKNFNYNDMLFSSGWGVDRWGPGSSLPDIRQLETRLWFYYLAKRYIDAGYEALHLGQVMETGRYDTDYNNWWDLIGKIRGYASTHALRHYVLLDAHVSGGIVSSSGDLMLDFVSFPQRPIEIISEPEHAQLSMSRSIFGDTIGGTHPSGWYCNRSPFIVEFDNFGVSSHPGTPNSSDIFVWGYDEITWFAKQPEQYRNDYLIYAWNWIRQNDSNGWLQMPGSRPLAVEVNSTRTYYASPPTRYRVHGFNQESTIAAIWGNTNIVPDIITSHRYDFEGRNANDSKNLLNGLPNYITYTTNSKVGNYAAVFNGISSYIQLPEVNFKNSFSITAWIFLEEPHNICTVFNNAYAGNAANGFTFYINNQWYNANGSLFFDTGNGTDAGNTFVSGNVVPANEWHHIAAVVNKSTGKVNLYVDGNLLKNQANIRNDFNTLNFSRFGSSINCYNYFKGRMDDIRVTSNLLTTTEIQLIADIPEPSILSFFFAVFFVLAKNKYVYAKFCWFP